MSLYRSGKGGSSKEEINIHRVKWLYVSLVLVLALGLAIPAVAQQLNNSEVPGSVIVFPKFISGTYRGEPNSQFEISVGCPRRNADGSCFFPEGFRVKIKAHWVCPADQKFEHKYICKETDFDLYTTVYGTISFSPANVGAPAGFPTTPLAPTAGGVQRVPPPPCERGYLIAWVVDTADRPIHFNALIGDAIIRDANGSVSAYNGIPIQAITLTGLLGQGLDTGLLIAGGLALGSPLPFTGLPIPVTIAGVVVATPSYALVSTGIQGSVRFDAGLRPGPAVTTDLTLLTLDVRSNRSNNPVSVDLNFYNANEYLVSTFWEFICWTEVSLSDVNGSTDFIYSGLTAADMGTQKGLVVSDFAIKLPFANVADDTGAVTLLGIVTTSVYNGTAYAYSYLLYHNNFYAFTTFFPTAFTGFVP
jgi:hypothetical protein